jgi:hypothetical protein
MRDNEYMAPSFGVTGLFAQYNTLLEIKKTGQGLLTETDFFFG